MNRNAPLARTTPLKPGKPLKGSGFLRSRVLSVVGRRIKSRGMVGRTPTAEEDRFMSAIASLGCLACAKDGRVNPWASIHHIDGRTKPGAHFLTYALCAGHHQAGTGEDKAMVAVHPDKARFEAKYGTQMELLAEAKQKLGLV